MIETVEHCEIIINKDNDKGLMRLLIPLDATVEITQDISNVERLRLF